MEGLGRLFNVIPIAASVVMKFRGAGAISFVTTGADTFTLSVGTSYAVCATSPGSIISYYYKTVAVTNGTVAWTKVTQAAANAWTVAGAAASLVTVHSAMIPDTYKYIKLVPTGGGLVTAIHHDLLVQRSPLNLEVLAS